MSDTPKPRSNAWFLLPILFGVMGGILAYVVIRRNDPQKARNCLYVGIVFMGIGIVINLIIYGQAPEIHQGINIEV